MRRHLAYGLFALLVLACGFARAGEDDESRERRVRVALAIAASEPHVGAVAAPVAKGANRLDWSGAEHAATPSDLVVSTAAAPAPREKLVPCPCGDCCVCPKGKCPACPAAVPVPIPVTIPQPMPPTPAAPAAPTITYTLVTDGFGRQYLVPSGTSLGGGCPNGRCPNR